MSDLLIYSWENREAKVAENQLDELLARQRARIATRLKKGPPYTWKNLVMLIDQMADERQKFWSPILQLSNVVTSKDPVVRDAARKMYERCQEKLTLFETELAQSRGLYRAYKYLADGRRRARLSKEQQVSIKATLEGARLAGVELPLKQKKCFKQIQAKLVRLEKRFADNVQDASGRWEKLIANRCMLKGLPEQALAAAQEAAGERNLEGYLFSLGDATLMTILETAHNRNLRRTFYKAWVSRATKRNDGDKKKDNGRLIDAIMAPRYESAQLLGQSNYVDVSLAYKMAESSSKVRLFLNELSSVARPFAVREYKQLAAYALQHDGIAKLEPWDMNYYLERLKAEKRGISQDELRKYFPIEHVFAGLLEITNRLYGITFKIRDDVKLWHQDAKFFDAYAPDGSHIAGVYSDLFERPGVKKGSAWVEGAVARWELPDGAIQLPVVYLNCNFKPPSNDLPTMLTMSEVEILFHEWGHVLHLLLTKVKEFELTGWSAVSDDACELPSQFMEEFCWVREGIELISKHSETGEKLPYKIYRKLRAAKSFGSGLYATWIVTRALFDFRLHAEYSPGKKGFAHTLFRELHDDPRPIFQTEYPWTPETFVHIFGGDGCEAGYFGYSWSKMLAVDAFSPFLVDGKIQWELGKRFEQAILSRGATRPFMDCFVAFRGRKPTIDALLRWYGFIK